MRKTVARALRLKATNKKGELIINFYRKLKKAWNTIPKDKRHKVRMDILEKAGVI